MKTCSFHRAYFTKTIKIVENFVKKIMIKISYPLSICCPYILELSLGGNFIVYKQNMILKK